MGSRQSFATPHSRVPSAMIGQYTLKPDTHSNRDTGTRSTAPHHHAVLQPGCSGQRDETGPRQASDDPFHFIDYLSQDDLREKQRVRPYMDKLYRLHKKPSFRNGKLFSEGREVTPREIAAYLDRV